MSFPDYSNSSRNPVSPSPRSRLSFILISIGYGMACMLLIMALSVMDPWKENITGLDHLHHQRWLLISCSLFSYGMCGIMTSLLTAGRQTSGSIWRMNLCMACCFGSSLVPYVNGGNPFFNDLHVWLNITGTLGYLLFWLIPTVFYGIKPDKVFQGIMLAYLCFLLLFALSGSISGMAEIVPMLIVLTVLYISLVFRQLPNKSGR